MLLAMLGAALAHTRSLVSPAVIWLTMWTMSFMLTAAWGSLYIIDPTVLILLFLGVIAFAIGCVAPLPGFTNNGYQRNAGGIGDVVKSANWIILACLVVSFVGAVIQSRHFGGGVFNVSSLQQAASRASDAVSSIYRGEQASPLGGRIGFAALQMGAVLSGLSLAAKHRQKTLSIIMALGLVVVALIYTSTTTTRSYTIIPMLWAFAGFAASKVVLGRERDINSLPFIGSSAVVLAVLVVFTLGFQIARTGEFRVSQFGRAAEHMRPWVAGSIPSLSGNYAAWDREVSIGQEFVGALGKIVGARESSQRGAQTTGNNMVPIGNGARANAATLFITLIRSFGEIGTVFAAFAIGVGSNWAYQSARRGSPFAWAFYPGIIVMIVWSPNTWFFSYGSRVLTIVGLLVVVIIAGALARATVAQFTGKRGRSIPRPPRVAGPLGDIKG